MARYAGRPLRAALEVGAGTGKATRPFASQGIEVTAVEPDAHMARLLEATTRDLPVNPVVSTFEAFESTSRFDLVYSAAAWHWTDPATRWTHALDLLATDGVLALFGRQIEPIDPDVTAQELVGLLSTVSAYVMLDERTRSETLLEIRTVLPDRLDVDTTVKLSMARRSTETHVLYE